MKEEIVVHKSEPIIPDTIIRCFRKHDIVKIHVGYHIKTYSILLDSKRNIDKVFLWDCFHPNAGDPNVIRSIHNPMRRNEFCLPSGIEGTPILDTDFLYLERCIFTIWYLDNPHHFPSNEHFICEPPL